MSSSSMILLFTEPRPISRDPYSVLLSGVAHFGVGGLIAMVLIFSPRVVVSPMPDRYAMRELELHMPVTSTPPELSKTPPLTHPDPPAPSTQDSPADSAQGADRPSAKPLLPRKIPARQTIVQPDLPDIALPQDIPLPSLLLWASKDDMSKRIVPPKIQDPVAAIVHPKMDMPNQEEKIADAAISSTAFNSAKLPVLPSTTSPVVVHGPAAEGKVPETTSTSSDHPTGARVMSLSDLVMQNGAVALPRVNQSAAGNANGNLGTGHGQNGSGGNTAAEGGGNGFGTGNSGSTMRITLPKNGKYSIVIVGASLEDQYPETIGMWSGRMAYTVYLHVGQSRNWILQYSLPHAADAAASGVAHLEAPYTTVEVVPNLAPGVINADALMVHGFINSLGHFEKMTIAFPPGFEQANFVLDALAQWQFRPAVQNGRPITVEVLLIIPETLE